MPIRFANIEDVPFLVEGGRRMHALTRFKKLPYDSTRVAHAFRTLIMEGQGKYAFFVAEGADHKIVGALIGVMEQHIFCAEWTASVMHFDVLPEARMGGYGVRLLKAFEKWACNRRAVEIFFGINSATNLSVVSKFAQKMGYHIIGENFAKQL